MATISQKKLLQLLRSKVYGDKTAAVNAIKTIEFENTKFDGTPLAVRYKSTKETAEGSVDEIKTLFVVYHNVSGEENAAEGSGYTIFDNATDGVLDHSEYVKETGILHLWFKQADGTLKEETVNLKEMLDIDDVVIGDDSKDYLEVTLSESSSEGDTGENMVLDIIKGTVAKPATTYSAEEAAEENATHLIEDESGKQPGDEGYVPTYPNDYTPVKEGDVKEPAVPATTGIATSEDVSKAIEDFVEILENEIEELQEESLTGVTVNGHLATPVTEGKKTDVAVTINGDDIKVASAYTKVEYADEFTGKTGVAAVAADDTVSAAFAKVEGTVKALVNEVLDNEEVSEKAIEALANAAGVVNSEGEIIYVGNPGNEILSAATDLNNADLLLAQAIKATEEKSATVVEALPEVGNSETLGAYVTPEEDETTKATTYFVDVNFDFGTF